MDKLIKGILEFRARLQPAYRKTFAKLALGQAPDALFITCSDSRVAVNVFASTDPGDLFVVRNVGNMVPECGEDGKSSADESEAAAIEFAVNQLKISHIIVCGHSECGAMQAIVNGREQIESPNLNAWLRHGEISEQKLLSKAPAEPHNKLSQLNVLQQLENLKTYPMVKKLISQGKLRLHGWWFDLKEADVYTYVEKRKSFELFSEDLVDELYSDLA